jgi:hypothetical protein
MSTSSCSTAWSTARAMTAGSSLRRAPDNTSRSVPNACNVSSCSSRAHRVGELGGVQLLGQIQVSVRLPSDHDRHPQKRADRRMTDRKRAASSTRASTTSRSSSSGRPRATLRPAPVAESMIMNSPGPRRHLLGRRSPTTYVRTEAGLRRGRISGKGPRVSVRRWLPLRAQASASQRSCAVRATRPRRPGQP